MAQLYLTLMTKSPLAIRSDHATGGSKTAITVNGSTLLGSLAAAHRMLYADTKNDDFVQLFLEGNISYPNLYQASFDAQEALGDELQTSHSPVYPVPKTAQSCKRFGGFLKESSDERHGVRDSLLDWAVFKLSDGHNISALKAHADCSYLKVNSKGCEEVMDHFSGFYRRSAYVDPPYHRMTAQVGTRLLTRTGISRDRHIVEEGILYNREVIDEEAYFWGMVNLPDTLLSTFKGFVEEAGDAGLIRIGTGRTRGLGQVQLTIHGAEDDEITFDSFKQRLVNFDANLRERMGYAPADEDDRFYFALTLHSPVILRDDLLRYQGTISGEVLAIHAKLLSTTLRQIHQVASIERVTGWNELWGTPRTQECAMATGSVFLFVAIGKASEERPDELLEKLFDLEEQGIGERRAEGFGRICFSDPFHLEEDRV